MEFDVKKYFPRKEGFGDTVLSIPEMQAEIARLQALLERREKLLTSCMMQRYTAWNEAIEVAAIEAASWWAYIHDEQYRDGPIAESIRALKRTQGHA